MCGRTRFGAEWTRASSVAPATRRSRHSRAAVSPAHHLLVTPKEDDALQPCSTEERAGPGPAHAPLASIATASEWSRGSAPRRGRRSLSQWSERIGRRGNELGLGLAGRGPCFGRPRSKADRWISSNGCAYCGHVNGPRGAIWAESVAGLRPKLGQSSRNTGLPKRFFQFFSQFLFFIQCTI